MNDRVKNLFDIVPYEKDSYEELGIIKKFKDEVYQFYIYSMDNIKNMACRLRYEYIYIYEYQIDNGMVEENNHIKEWSRKKKIGVAEFRKFVDYNCILLMSKYLNKNKLSWMKN